MAPVVQTFLESYTLPQYSSLDHHCVVKAREPEIKVSWLQCPPSLGHTEAAALSSCGCSEPERRVKVLFCYLRNKLRHHASGKFILAHAGVDVSVSGRGKISSRPPSLRPAIGRDMHGLLQNASRQVCVNTLLGVSGCRPTLIYVCLAERSVEGHIQYY